MEKTIKLTEERINFLSDYLEKTKDAKDQATLSNREKAAETMSNFKDLAETTKSIVKQPTYEKAENLIEIIKVTVDELIAHNQKGLAAYQKMLDSLNMKINQKPEEADAEKSIINDFKNVHTQLSSYIKQCVEVKDELNVIIEKSVSVEEELEGVAVIDLDGVTSTETPIENIDEEHKKEDVRHWDNEDLWEATQLEDVIESNDDDDDENINEKYEQENKKEDDTNEFPI
jgi:hypothetical protein